MAKLEGDEALKLHEELKRKNAERRRKALEDERRAAATRGKEPFDLDALERLCDTSSEGRLDPVDERRDRYEYGYYVEHPSIMTIAEYAEYITSASKW
jgi:hypothetical protein